MRSQSSWAGVVGTVVCLGCGGTVEISGSGAGGGGSTAISTSGGGGSGGSTATLTETTTSMTTSTTVTVEDGCPDLPSDAFWVDVQVGGESYHLTAACPFYNEPYGPSAYAWTNGKSGPEWYFTISACEGGIPEGSSQGPSVLIVAGIPQDAAVMVPYSTAGDITHVTKDQSTLGPATSPKIVFQQFGPAHGLVTGTFAGIVTLPDGQSVSIDGQFSVCRRSDIIYI